MLAHDIRTNSYADQKCEHAPEPLMIEVLIILMVLIPAWCYAEGNELLKRCDSLVSYTDSESSDISPSGEMMFCAGFMQGITNMNLLYQTILKSDAQFCLPEWGISNSHAARIVVKHLRDYPEELHRHEIVLAIWALKVAFPCKKGD